jgi:hypothetical protein
MDLDTDVPHQEARSMPSAASDEGRHPLAVWFDRPAGSDDRVVPRSNGWGCARGSA